jgi:hypothetical protein
MPAPDPVTGLMECRWAEPHHLRTADGDGPWPSGVYLARLTARASGRQAYVVFVVRDDTRRAALLFQSSVTTFAAYNNWGGRSLYAFNSAGAPARAVSFDRPYAMNPYGVPLDGAGDFLRRFEYNALRWLEREGYDVAYATDVDTHRRSDCSRGIAHSSRSATTSTGRGRCATTWRPRATAGCTWPSWGPTRASGRSASSRTPPARPTAPSWATRTAPPPTRWPPIRRGRAA